MGLYTPRCSAVDYYSMGVGMNNITERIDRLMKNAMEGIAMAANRQDLMALESLTQRATEMRAMRDQIVAIDGRLRSLENGSAVGAGQRQPSSGARDIRVEVTQGMINQNLLTLSDAIKRGQIKAGEVLNITALPSGDIFVTELLEAGNKLRERGKIGKFYRDAAVHAGDVVMLREVTPGRWELRKVTG